MDMLDGKYWGNYKKLNEEIYDEDFFADFEDYIIDHNKVIFLQWPQWQYLLLEKILRPRI